MLLELDLVGRIMWSWNITIILSSSTLNSVIFFWRNEILRKEAKKTLHQTFLNCAGVALVVELIYMATDKKCY